MLVDEMLSKMVELKERIGKKGEELQNEWNEFESKVIRIRDGFEAEIEKMREEISDLWLKGKITEVEEEKLIEKLEEVEDYLYDAIESWFPERI